MGCDIHMVLERLHGGEWIGINTFPYMRGIAHDLDATGEFRQVEGVIFWRQRDRNYELFAALAGVRGEGPAPRGLPDDISALAAMQTEEWGADGHSHTHYPLAEALPLFRRHAFQEVKRIMEGETNEQHRIWRALDYFGVAAEELAQLDDYRLIIWFDN